MEVNIGYAWGELMRARQTAAEHADAGVQARARETAAKWESVIAGMQAGTIDVGSRTPTKAPAWVTLDVVTGGFATGGYGAGGALRDHETALAARLGIPATRVALNLHFLTSPETGQLLASGRYRVDVPEEGALLVVAWLRARGAVEAADALVRELAPWFEELRFYPVPSEQPAEVKETVRLQDVGTTLKGIDVDRRQRRFETMRGALLVWKPLRERALALIAETDSPGWSTRVEQLAADVAAAGTPTTQRARKTAQLVTRLSRYARDRDPSEHGALRNALARHVAAHGAPGTPESGSRAAAEAKAVAAPRHADLRRVLVARLRALPPDAGVELESALAPVAADEAERFRVPAGSELPAYLEPKVARSSEGSLEDLVERGVIASGEVFARVLPQVTSQVRARTIADEVARRLYVALYTAFRRRRGLLLVNYQHQVRFQELPWVAALEAARVVDGEASERARSAVAGVSGLALRAFPYTIVPNKLVTELSSLASAAELKLPLVEELAADIFMGSFTAKFVEAAKVSARLLAGTLYQRYYAIDTAEIATLTAAEGKTFDEFAAICERRAAPLATKGRSFVASNGKILEQAQILTTHNLAVLFDALPLRSQLAPHLRPIAETCFAWVLRRLQLPPTDWHQLLVNLKNAAYAWRQMLFYLSFCEDVPAFATWCRSKLERADESFRQRFEPVIRGLEIAAAGGSSDDAAFARGGGRVFTGWSTDRHWLLPARE